MTSFSTSIDVKNANILIIDPQVDFHEGGNLPVTGAKADSERISKFIEKHVNELKKIYQEVEFLVTTGTLSSANIVNKWLPAGVYHEFTPIDNFFIVRRFYKYWQPKLGIFIELDMAETY